MSVDKAGNIHAIKGKPKIVYKAIMIWSAWDAPNLEDEENGF